MEDNFNLGGKIKDTVQSVLDSDGFKGLNEGLESFAKQAMSEIKKNTYKKETDKMEHTGPVAYVEKTKRILFFIFGIIGVVIFGFSLLGSLILLPTKAGSLIGTIGVGLLLALGVYMIKSSQDMKKREQRASRYLGLVTGSGFNKIDVLSEAILKDDKFVIKDLKDMINKGFFPQGHLDKAEKYFFLNDKIYSEYMKLQTSMDIKKEASASREELSKNQDNKNISKSELDPEVLKIVNEGRSFVKTIREANDEIPGEEISNKLDKLEIITNKIYDHIEYHPEKIAETKKFSEYFLPTTLKLVETYRRIDGQTFEGENILNSKREIEASLDTINHAFENLLNTLFEDVSLDISTDISVLETMLMQEGLTSNDMKIDSK